MKRYVISDTHFGHANMCVYGHRPFRRKCEFAKGLHAPAPERVDWGEDCPTCSVMKADAHMIREWNMRVKPGDMVDHLGDFCFKNTPNAAARGEGSDKIWSWYWNQLNGEKSLIEGNHETNNGGKPRCHHQVVTYGGATVGMVHRPEDAVQMVLDDRRAPDLWLVGHVHDAWKTRAIEMRTPGSPPVVVGMMLNMSVEMWEYRPVLLTDAINELKKAAKQAKEAVK